MFELNGKMYQVRPDATRKAGMSTLEWITYKIRDLGYDLIPQLKKIPSHVNLIKEYGLIQDKKCKLPSALRARIIRVFENRYVAADENDGTVDVQITAYVQEVENKDERQLL